MDEKFIYSLGMRFYIFDDDDDDEYQLFDLVMIDKDDEYVLMNEETLELQTVNKQELQNDYILLDNYVPFAVVGMKDKQYFVNEEIRNETSYIREFPSMVDFIISMKTYAYIKQVAFKHMINYILKMNCNYEATEDDLNYIWNRYFMYANKFTMETSHNLDDNVTTEDNNYLHSISESLFVDIEEKMGIYVLTYQLYKYDTSIDMAKINMKYLILYNADIDTYYLMLYISDNRRNAAERIKELEENIDVINFMNK